MDILTSLMEYNLFTKLINILIIKIKLTFYLEVNSVTFQIPKNTDGEPIIFSYLFKIIYGYKIEDYIYIYIFE